MDIGATNITQAEASLLIGVLTFLGVVVNGIFTKVYGKHSKDGAKDAKEANAAVNHTKAGEPRLWDLVFENHQKAEAIEEWIRRWDGTPWKGGEDIKEWLIADEKRMQAVEEKVDRMMAACPGCEAKAALEQLQKDVSEIKKKLMLDEAY